MKLLLVFGTLLVGVSLPAVADGHHGWGRHGRHHGGDWGYRGGPRYYTPPPVVVRQYMPAYYAPPAPVYYAPPPPAYVGAPVVVPARGALPIIAGGVLGGLVGNQIGYGNPGAIIAGSVAGSVLGHEIAR